MPASGVVVAVDPGDRQEVRELPEEDDQEQRPAPRSRAARSPPPSRSPAARRPGMAPTAVFSVVRGFSGV